MIHGVINVYKEAGFTSHDVVAKLRGILHQKRIGHTGTLDPDAVGVLPVCLGRATRLADYLGGESKTYEAVLLLGRVTDTQDTSGETREEHPVTCSEEEVRACIASFTGKQEQIPPMVSAKKVNGKKLYELAREGKEVERRPSVITIHQVEILALELPRVRMRVTCSKGTYIRTLCHDIGQALGCGGCMEELTRTRSGHFCIENTFRLCEIEEAVSEDRIEDILLLPDSFFPELAKAQIAAEATEIAHHGNGISCRMIQKIEDGERADTAFDKTKKTDERILLYEPDGAFLGIYQYRSRDKRYYPEIFFYET